MSTTIHPAAPPATSSPASPATPGVGAPPSTPGAATPAAPSHGPPPPVSRRRRPVMRRALLAGVVLLVAALIVRALRPAPLSVETAVVARRPMRATVQADALTRVDARFTVTAPVAGFVERLELKEGSRVRAGSVVATMSTAPAHPSERAAAAARVDAARALERQAAARVSQASAALAQAERDARRTNELVAGGALPDREVERAALDVANRRADLDAARSQSRVALAELEQARVALTALSPGAPRIAVRSPAAGVVLRVPEPSARVVPAGTPLLEIGDPQTLEVVADVLSSDATLVRAAQPVELRGWGGAPLRGFVRRVEPSARTRVSALGVEEQRLNVVIDLFDSPEVLGDRYRLDASIIVWEHANTLSVPASALLRDGDGWVAYVVRDGRAARRAVRVGHLGSGFAEITDGLAAGDTVIAFPPDALRDGVRVRSVGVP